MQNQETEHYWDQVALQISNRDELNIIAGDNEPYYHYKRKLFLKLLDKIDFEGKSILEIGSGPGGNLFHISGKNPGKLAGVDISAEMIALSGKLLKGKNIEIKKTDGHHLPFEDRSFQLVFTSTVLQHNTDEQLLKNLIKEITRVASKEIIIFERIEKNLQGHESNVGRPVSYYEELFKTNGFSLKSAEFLKIQASYFVCGAIRKIFNSKKRKEGEPVSRLSYFLESASLPITKLIDPLIPSHRDLGMLRFRAEHRIK